MECRLFLAISTHIFDKRFQETLKSVWLAHGIETGFCFTHIFPWLVPVVRKYNVKPLKNLNGYENDIRDALYAVGMRK